MVRGVRESARVESVASGALGLVLAVWEDQGLASVAWDDRARVWEVSRVSVGRRITVAGITDTGIQSPTAGAWG